LQFYIQNGPLSTGEARQPSQGPNDISLPGYAWRISSLHFAASIATSIAVSIAASGCRLVGLNTPVVYYSRIETNSP
jgi:hypothetical protein